MLAACLRGFDIYADLIRASVAVPGVLFLYMLWCSLSSLSAPSISPATCSFLCFQTVHHGYMFFVESTQGGPVVFLFVVHGPKISSVAWELLCVFCCKQFRTAWIRVGGFVLEDLNVPCVENYGLLVLFRKCLRCGCAVCCTICTSSHEIQPETQGMTSGWGLAKPPLGLFLCTRERSYTPT